MTVQSAGFHEVGRDALSNSTFYFMWFPLPPVFHISPHFVGVGFGQDQVIWLQ